MINPVRCLTPALLVVVLLLGGCADPLSQLEGIRERGELKVVTVYGPTTYFVDTDSETGFEYELARLFARHLNVGLSMIVAANKAEVIDILQRGEADVAVGLLKKTFLENPNLEPGPEYQTVTQQVIYKNGMDRPRVPDDLYPYQLHVANGVIREEVLQELKQQHPDFSWKYHPDRNSHDLIEMVHNDEIAYAAVYSNELILARQTYPELRSAFEISEPSPLAWFTRRDGDISLQIELEAFYSDINASEHLAELIEYFYGPVQKFDYVDQRKFIERYSHRLPAYEAIFREAATSYQFDWRLLAAMSYQESHWNERARSPTGVRGLMMLTLDTARQVGIKNRLDPTQSIMGGAKYIRQLADRIPERIPEPDRIWFALAAYNIGLGHLEDARVITEKQGGNPDKWQDVRTYLPWLQRRDHYKQTLYGYARGNEAVNYVESIRRYYNSLVQLTHNELPPTQPVTGSAPIRIVEIESLAL